MENTGINAEEIEKERKKETFDRSKGNSTAKGCDGKRKHYFTGKYKKKRAKRSNNKNFNEGDVLIYESAGTRLFKGVVKEKCDMHEECYLVKPNINADQRIDHVPACASPKDVTTLQLSDPDFVVGALILFTWQILDDGFVELRHGYIAEVNEDYCWVVTNEQNLIRVGREEMCKCLAPAPVNKQMPAHSRVGQENINVVRLVMQACRTQMETITMTYQKTKTELEEAIDDNLELNSKNLRLAELLEQSLTTIQTLQEQLLDKVKFTQTHHTLQQVISDQQDKLDNKSEYILTLEQDIHALREDYQEQQTSLESTIQELKANIAKLENENDELKETIHLQRNRGGGLQKNPQMKADDNVIGLREELQKRYHTFIRIEKPTKPSSNTTLDKKTLKRRAEKIHEVSP